MCTDGHDYPRLAWELEQIGDFTCPDGVAIEDVVVMGGAWLSPDERVDITGNGVVNFEDFGRLAARWFKIEN